MKTISLSKTENWDDRSVLKNMVEMSPPNGYNVGEIKTALACLDALEGDGDLKLEDEQHRFLVERFSKMQWAVARPEIVALHERIAKAA